ncbi:MAG: heme ABC exporter ATP-binding protein CcmA [Caulobacter sp.]|nr:heme ABC exporter ATP-binding protein CcmA [Caulobacter sp.]
MISGLAVEDLAIRRGERLLFEHLSFAAEAGEAVALVGRNGAGKTSLLRAVAGLLRPAAGTVRFGGARDIDEARAADLHLIGHHDGLKGGRTAREELAFAARWCGAGDAGLARAAEALDLGRLLDLEVRKLSAGQRRRLALARLVAAPRTLWLLDEPLAPLDSVWRERIGALIADHLAAGGMLLAAVHDPLPVAARAVEIGA